MGVVTTAWYNFPLECFYPGIMYTGRFGAAADPIFKTKTKKK